MNPIFDATLKTRQFPSAPNGFNADRGNFFSKPPESVPSYPTSEIVSCVLSAARYTPGKGLCWLQDRYENFQLLFLLPTHTTLLEDLQQPQVCYSLNLPGSPDVVLRFTGSTLISDWSTICTIKRLGKTYEPPKRFCADKDKNKLTKDHIHCKAVCMRNRYDSMSVYRGDECSVLFHRLPARNRRRTSSGNARLLLTTYDGAAVYRIINAVPSFI